MSSDTVSVPLFRPCPSGVELTVDENGVPRINGVHVVRYNIECNADEYATLTVEYRLKSMEVHKDNLGKKVEE